MFNSLQTSLVFLWDHPGSIRHLSRVVHGIAKRPSGLSSLCTNLIAEELYAVMSNKQSPSVAIVTIAEAKHSRRPCKLIHTSSLKQCYR